MTVQGLDRLNRRFSQLPTRIRRHIEEAMEALAAEMVALARRLAAKKSGALAESIGWTWGKAPKGSLVLGTVRAQKTGNLVITIHAGDDKAFYARWVEFGTAPHENGGAFDGSDHPGTLAEPFFFPAWRAVRRRGKTRISRAIGKAAREVAANG